MPLMRWMPLNSFYPKKVAAESPNSDGGSVKKSMHVALEDEEIIELMRILMDDDAEAALAFLKKHFKGKARELLEGG
jgi:hypothetical protein